jgi:hypothetical protein
MGKTQNKNNLSKEDVNSFYNYLCLYETEIKQQYGQYNFEHSDFINFCSKNKIERKNRKSKLDNKFYFETFQRDKINDKAHHLLRHIRNSVAHGLVQKKGKNFILRDFNRNNNETMYGCIRVDLFWNFIKELIATRNKK